MPQAIRVEFRLPVPSDAMSTSQRPTVDEIHEVIRTEFGLDPTDHVVNIEIVRRAQDPERYDGRRAEFEKELAQHADPSVVQRRSYFGETFAIHLQSWFPRAEVEGLRAEMTVHYPVCTIEEMRRIESPSNAADHLLALRADAIADSPRLKRVFLKRREQRMNGWSLTSCFDAASFERYLSVLPQDLQARCRSIPAGMAFLREPNGACIRSPHGDYIVVSEALQAYLYYMNVFLLAQEDIPMDDCVAALMIALRTMFLTETPDFDLDPRGQLPEELDRQMTKMVNDQLQLVIGHEYAHVLLGHLDGRSVRPPPLGVLPVAAAHRPMGYHALRHQQEFAADAGALLHATLSDDELADRLNASTWLFFGFEILQVVSAHTRPSLHVPQTHPAPYDRVWALREAVLGARRLAANSVYSEEQISQGMQWVEGLKKGLLKDFVQKQIHALESYGSVYLPSFRGPKRHDRLDY